MDAPDAWLTPRMLDEKIRALVADARRRHDLPVGCAGMVACARLGLRLHRAPLPGGIDGLLAGDCVVGVRQPMERKVGLRAVAGGDTRTDRVMTEGYSSKGSCLSRAAGSRRGRNSPRAIASGKVK